MLALARLRLAGRVASGLAPRRALKTTAPKAEAELYSERMYKTGRPVSPHLINENWGMHYALPAIAWSSVMVRITGFVASAGFFVLGGATLVGGGPWAVDTAQAISEAVSPAFAKFAVAYTLSYQWFGSARHAYWDLTAKGFNNATMRQGAYAMWAVTAGLSLALAATSLPPLTKKDDKK